jgi:hypothetical protein
MVVVTGLKFSPDAKADQLGSENDHLFGINTKHIDSGSAHRRPSFDDSPPQLEMLRPAIMAWVKQSLHDTRLRVNAG